MVRPRSGPVMSSRSGNKAGPNQTLHLTAGAFSVSRGARSLQPPRQVSYFVRPHDRAVSMWWNSVATWWSSVMSPFRLSARRFTDGAVKVVNVATRQAAEHGHASVAPDHLLLALALVQRGSGRGALERLGLDLARERGAIAALLAELPQAQAQQRPTMSAEAERVVDEAVVQARALRHKYVGTEHLTLAVIAAGPSQAEGFLRQRGITLDNLREAVLAVLSE